MNDSFRTIVKSKLW